jgi:hypothetical protein
MKNGVMEDINPVIVLLIAARILSLNSLFFETDAVGQ